MLTPIAVRHLLDEYPVLHGLAPHDLAALASGATDLAFAPGAAVFREGDDDLPLVLLRRGHVRVSRALPTGQRLTVYHVGPGAFCAVNAALVFGGGQSPASGHAIDDVSAVALPRPLANGLLARCHAFRQAVFAAFSIRMDALFSFVDDLAIHSLDRRLATLLLARAPIVDATHQTLADELGTVREVVSRILHRFATDGLIRQSRARVEVLDRAGLGHVAGRPDMPLPTRCSTTSALVIDRTHSVTPVTDAGCEVR